MMRKSTLVFSVALLAGTAAAQNSTVTVDTLRADTARVGVIAPKPAQEEGLVLYLPFETDTGNTALDASGNGHNGNAVNCVWSSAGCFAGGAMSFNGSNSSIGFPTAPDFPSWGAYTVGVWFKHNGGGVSHLSHKLVDKTSMMHDWHLHVHPLHQQFNGVDYLAGRLAFTAYESGALVTWNDCSKDYRDNQWHHVAVIRDGTNGQLWVDGEIKFTTDAMIPVYSSSAFCIGNSFSTDPNQRASWSGQIDEVRVYDRALSPAEIGELYTTGLLALPNPPTAVEVSGDLSVDGTLTVTGEARFPSGIRLAAPLGDLSSGIYTSAP